LLHFIIHIQMGQRRIHWDICLFFQLITCTDSSGGKNRIYKAHPLWFVITITVLLFKKFTAIIHSISSAMIVTIVLTSLVLAYDVVYGNYHHNRNTTLHKYG